MGWFGGDFPHYFRKHPYVPASILIVTLPSFLELFQGAKTSESWPRKSWQTFEGGHGEFGDVFFFALEDGIPGEAPVVNDPSKLSHLEVEQMEEPTVFFKMFSGWFWRMGENEDWLDWYLWGVNVCQQHLARKPRNRGSCSLWMLMNELLYLQCAMTNWKSKLTSQTLQILLQRCYYFCLLNGIVYGFDHGIHHHFSSPFWGYIYIFVIYLSFCL